MKNTISIFLVVWLITVLITNCENSKDQSCNYNMNTISKEIESFLIKNQFSVIDVSDLSTYSYQDSFQILNFLKEAEEKREYRNGVMDTILSFVNLEFIEEEIENSNIELLRLIRTVGAMGKNEILIAEGKYIFGDSVDLKEIVINLKKGYDWLDYYLEGPKKAYLEIASIREKRIHLDEWNGVRRLLIKTNLSTTAYHENNVNLICDGYNYELEYHGASQTHKDYRKIVKSCPGDLTAIYIISEKLISLFD